ncbi:MAG: HD-GYP domain-containing protein [Nevskia sp.]|nr:HD-GYP domain-containing protein [Nevskia sp.]
MKLLLNPPESPRQLRRQVLWVLTAAGILIAALVAVLAYVAAAQHVERAAVGRVQSAFGHFDSAAMLPLFQGNSGGSHEDLLRQLDREHFVGIRLRDPDGRVLAQFWADGIEPELRQAATDARPRFAGDLLRSGGEAFVRVARSAPVGSAPGGTVAEALYRLDPETVHSIDQQVRGAALIGATTVLVTTVLLYPILLALSRRALRLSLDLLRSNFDLMLTLGSAIALRDAETDAHNYRVTLYAIRLAEAVGMPPAEIADVIAGAFLHDVGKIGIPDAILLKPGPLAPEELRVMQRHPLLGERVVNNNPWLVRARTIVLCHHERYDGSGYPGHLAGTAIPRAARLFAIVDVFDALTTKRPYKPAFTLDQALQMMQTDMAGKFDPALLAVFTAGVERLFLEIGQAPPGELQIALGDAVRRYFPAAGPPATRQPPERAPA